MKTVIIVIILVGVALFVSGMSREDPIKEDAYYNEMVCGGWWPDYHNEKPDCAKIRQAQLNTKE